MVERSYILSPQSSFDLLNESEQLYDYSSPFHQKICCSVNCESAYEKLTEKSARRRKEREEEDKSKELQKKASQKQVRPSAEI